MKYIYLTIVLLLMPACSVIEDEKQKVQFDYAQDKKQLSYTGPLTLEDVEAALRLVGDRPIESLSISSVGGFTDAGMRLGYWVFNNQISVTVRDICASSCANYVFTAAKRRIIRPNTVIAWHGGALQNDWEIPWYISEDKAANMLEQWRFEEQDFFTMIGVNQLITVIGQRSPYKAQVPSGNWTYDQQSLVLLGVGEIEFADNIVTDNSITQEMKMQVTRLTINQQQLDTLQEN
ncbi:hypothetical protein [Thalassotalea sp. Y01]|uniref:hypothetical protein n=1 Tax=Thalassotalea sp. Y01 TaxID=2729613 RepID=UPI00145E83B4|nr:hypothetical protein [Thalassotalea sp. Y01]NMP16900.1 hypothetical protein [Thalassotalea sp. Y01]